MRFARCLRRSLKTASWYTLPTLSEISEYAKREMETFWDEYKRLHSPHRYKVDLSKPLYELKRGMLEERRSKA